MTRTSISHSWRTIRGMRICITHRKGSAGSPIPALQNQPHPRSCEQRKPVQQERRS